MASKKKPKLKLADLGEMGMIDWIRNNMPGNVSGLLRGIGDDAAVMRGGELVSVDMLVEGIHFQTRWQDFHKLGRKALAVNISDLAAMGGEARCAFLSLGIKGNTPLQDVQDFFTGFGQTAREHGMAVAGGDLTGSTGPMIISVAVVGRAERPVLRSGARPGDLLYVTGTIGDASMALKFLQRKAPKPGGKQFKHLYDRFVDPRPRVAWGRKISQYSSAMIDLSDGLAQDLNNLCRESGVGARIRMEKLPLSPAYRYFKSKVKKKEQPEFYHEALYGGEDYELLFAIPPSLRETFRQMGEGFPLTEIGEVVEAAKGVFMDTPQGSVALAKTSDFSHFKK